MAPALATLQESHHPHTHLTHHKELHRDDHATAEITKDPSHTHSSHLSSSYMKISSALATLQETPPSPYPPTPPPPPPPQKTSPITRFYQEMTTPLQSQPKPFTQTLFIPVKEVHKDGLCTGNITRDIHPP